jgi:oxygen-dependent protoporphyrinogen oxidase
MASGVFAGDATKMSLMSCFPRIHEVETQYGSLIRGLVTLQMKARAAGKKNVPGPGPGGRLTSFGQGMSELTNTLADRLGARLHKSTPVVSVSRDAGRYTLHMADGSQVEAEAIVLAVPAYAQAGILRELDPRLAQLAGAIAYPPLTVVCLGYEPAARPATLDGFGFLVPSGEQRSILGTIVDSNVFPGRAPAGHMLLRTMVGGAKSPHLAELPDDGLLERVCSDLQDITGLAAEPMFTRIFRHEKAIPQYAVGHASRLDAIEQALLRHPGLVLSGNAYRGVSLNDCVVNAWKAAGSIS